MPVSHVNRYRELATRLQRDGGFTYRPRVGYPDHGYAVSVYPDRERIIPRVTISALKDYRKAVSDIISSDRQAYLGGWSDPQSGNVYLDVVRLADTPEAADKLAIEHHQLAWFDLSSGITHYVEGGHHG